MYQVVLMKTLHYQLKKTHSSTHQCLLVLYLQDYLLYKVTHCFHLVKFALHTVKHRTVVTPYSLIQTYLPLTPNFGTSPRYAVPGARANPLAWS